MARCREKPQPGILKSLNENIVQNKRTAWQLGYGYFAVSRKAVQVDQFTKQKCGTKRGIPDSFGRATHRASPLSSCPSKREKTWREASHSLLVVPPRSQHADGTLPNADVV